MLKFPAKGPSTLTRLLSFPLLFAGSLAVAQPAPDPTPPPAPAAATAPAATAPATSPAPPKQEPAQILPAVIPTIPEPPPAGEHEPGEIQPHRTEPGLPPPPPKQGMVPKRRFLPHEATPITPAGPIWEPGGPLPGKLTIVPYGVIKGDLFFSFSNNRSGVNTFDSPQFGTLVPDGMSTDLFGASARKTRFGVHAIWPSPPTFLRATSVEAKVEIDFFGGVLNQGVPSYFSLPRLRFAWAAVSWGRTRLVFGQDNILIAPQVPDSMFRIIPQAGGFTGNLFGRYPQVRVEGSTSGKVRFIWSGGFLANVLNDGLSISDSQINLFRRPQGGEFSLSPMVQAHFGIGGEIDKKPWTVGLGGHYARRNTQVYSVACAAGATCPPTALTETPDGNNASDGWAVSLDALIPLHRTLVLKGEVWIGDELEALAGGINQGLNLTRGGPNSVVTSVNGSVRAAGGWVELLWNPIPWLQVSTVFLGDDPFDDTLSAAANTRLKILSSYNWVAIELLRGFFVGVEYDYIRTDVRTGQAASPELTLESHFLSLNNVFSF